MTFRLSPDVVLPPTAPTSTFAYLGTRGSGKTYGAGVMVESFLSARVQVVVMDPVGVWWALRLAADGKARGFDIPVFGGIHGDVPLEPTAGELVAHLVVEQRVSLVLDISDFTDGQQRRFVEAFARTFFQLKKRNKSPTHLVFEEAHEFFPQVVDAASAPMVGATKRLWKVGRNYGIGGTLISTRAAEINKNALNISDRVITGRLTAPEDVKRIRDWASSNGVNAEQVAALTSMPKGKLIVWRDPSEGGAVVTTFRAKTTFDASRTPEAGDEQPDRGLPAVDLVAIRAAMAATIEEAKANDPKVLRDEIVDLKRRITERNAAPADPDLMKALTSDRDMYRARCSGLADAATAAMARANQLERSIEKIIDLAEGVRTLAQPLPNDEPESMVLPPESAIPFGSAPAVAPTGFFWDNTSDRMGPFPSAVAPKQHLKLQLQRTNADPSIAFTKTAVAAGAGDQRMLRALSSRHPVPLTTSQLGVLALIKPSGGSFDTYLSRLRTGGLIESKGPKLWGLTKAGAATARSDGEAQPGPAALIDLWRAKLQGGAKRMLDALVRGQEMTKGEIAEASGISVTGGSFDTYMSKLRSNGLIERSQRGFRAVRELLG